MKVQTKITLLLLAVVAVFMAGLWAFRAYDQKKFREIRTDRLVEAKRAFDAFLVKDGEPLETLVDYDTTWDTMVQAIQTNNQKWLSDNVTNETPAAYKASAVWFYSPNTPLIYPRNALPLNAEQKNPGGENKKNPKPADLPLP